MPKIYGSQSGRREVLLTFDDGPHPTFTPKLLDTLGEQGIKAVFFVLGQNIEGAKGKEIIRRASSEGHFIGNHTYSHPNLKNLTRDQVRTEIKKTMDLIGDADRGVKLFRPPYGAHNDVVDAIAKELGYRMMFWNVDPLDWHADYKAGKWVPFALDQIRSREDSLVLAHDIHRTTVEKVGDLIAGLKEIRNIKFDVPV